MIKVGSKKAKNVIVFEPGTSAGAAYIAPFAKSLVEKLPNWQVWSVERRENLLEDQSLHHEGQEGHGTPQELFHYYLGYLAESPELKPHIGNVNGAEIPFTRKWGMNVAVEDLHTVIGDPQNRSAARSSWRDTRSAARS